MRARDRGLAWLVALDERVDVEPFAIVTLAGLVLPLGQKSCDDPFGAYRFAANLLNGGRLVCQSG